MRDVHSWGIKTSSDPRIGAVRSLDFILDCPSWMTPQKKSLQSSLGFSLSIAGYRYRAAPLNFFFFGPLVLTPTAVRVSGRYSVSTLCEMTSCCLISPELSPK